MAVEHVDTGAEAVERPPAVEAPPPPPPDRPGAEDFPSRADSRAAASAAFDQSRQNDDTTEAGSDTSASETTEEQSASHEDRTESSPAPEQDEFDAREGDAWDSPTGTDHDPVDEREQQPHPENAFRTETAADELAPVDTATQTELLDHRTPSSSEDADTRDRPAALDAPAETADDQRPDDLASPVALPGAEREQLSSGAEGSALTAAVVEADTEQVSNTADVEVPVRESEIGQQTQPSADEATGMDGPEQESPGDGGGLSGEHDAEVASTAEEERVPIFEWSTDDGKRARAYLDLPDEEANELDKPGSPPDPPTGEELLEAENDDLSQPEKLRRKFHKVLEDTHEVTSKTAKTGQDIFGPRPTGLAETKVPDGGAVMVDAQHAGIDLGSAAGAAFVVGVVGAELIRWALRKVRS